jgi:hypothetical protein
MPVKNAFFIVVILLGVVVNPTPTQSTSETSPSPRNRAELEMLHRLPPVYHHIRTRRSQRGTHRRAAQWPVPTNRYSV